MGATSEFQLKNGVTVVYEYIPHTQIVSVQAWLKTGSVNENEQNNGISHFLEHILFKGTKNFMPDEIDSVAESHGGIINAGTSKDYTTYYITLPSEHADVGSKIISDMVFNASFIADEIEKEKPVVVQEIQRKFDNPTYDMWTDAMSILFAGTPYEMEIIGTAENVNSFTRDMLVQYYKSHYHPHNTTLVVVGDIDEKTVRSLAEKYFNVSSSVKAAKGYAATWKPTMDKLVTKQYTRDVSQDYVLIAYQVDAVAADAPVYEVLTEVLSGGEYSILSQDLKYDKGLVTAVSSGELLSKSAGAYFFYLVTNPGDVDKAVKALDASLAKVTSGGISPQELQKAKNRLKSRTVFQKEKSSSEASEIGYSYTLGLKNYYNTYLDRIDSVSATDVANVLKSMLKRARLQSVTIPVTAP